MSSKQELRRAFRSRLQSAEGSGQSTQALNDRLTGFLKSHSGLWAGFQPIGFEPDIRPAIENSRTCTWAFPRVEGEELAFYTGSAQSFVANQWGIAEPDPSSSEKIEERGLTGVLVPGIAFDNKGTRLGRGRGYYDRALAGILHRNPNVIKVGVAFDAQISSDPLPVEPFDVPMDWILTPTRTLERDRVGSGKASRSERKA